MFYRDEIIISVSVKGSDILEKINEIEKKADELQDLVQKLRYALKAAPTETGTTPEADTKSAE